MKPTFTKSLQSILSLDLRSLALMRVGTAILLLTILWTRSLDLTAFYTDAGIFPRSESLKALGNIPFSLHLLSGSPGFEAMLFLIAAVFALLLLVGYKTRIATIVSYILLTSLINRSGYVANAGDAILDVILLWGIFLPWQARFSVDSIRNAKYKLLNNTFFSAGSIGYTFQVFCIYFFASLLKDNLEWRVYGTAVQIALQSRHTTMIGYALLQLPFWVLKALNFFVLFYEFFGALFLLYPRRNGLIRTFVIFGFIIMHISFGICLNLGAFSQIAIVALSGLLPGFFWLKLDFLTKKIMKERLVIIFDGMCGSCATVIQVINTFLLVPSLTTTPLQENPALTKEMNSKSSWIIIDKKGQHYHKYNGVHLLIRNSPILFLFTPLSLLIQKSGLGDRLYTFVASNRTCNIKPDKKVVAKKPFFEQSKFTRYFCILLLTWIVFSNILSLFRLQKIPFSRIFSLSATMQLSQSWVMFSHVKLYPTKKWIVIPGKLKDGRVVDLFQNGKPLSWKTPIVVSETFKNSSWITLMNELTTRRGGYNFKQYGSFLCTQWDQHHSNQQRLQTLDMYLASQEYTSNLPEAQFRTPLLTNFACPQ